jgi:hypothetical protein
VLPDLRPLNGGNEPFNNVLKYNIMKTGKEKKNVYERVFLTKKQGQNLNVQSVVWGLCIQPCFTPNYKYISDIHSVQLLHFRCVFASRFSSHKC